jgi:hypothetical protein
MDDEFATEKLIVCDLFNQQIPFDSKITTEERSKFEITVVLVVPVVVFVVVVVVFF